MEKNYNRKLKPNESYVQNANGEIISITYADRAMKFVFRGRAEIVSDQPLTVRFFEQIEVNDNEQ